MKYLNANGTVAVGLHQNTYCVCTPPKTSETALKEMLDLTYLH